MKNQTHNYITKVEMSEEISVIQIKPTLTSKKKTVCYYRIRWFEGTKHLIAYNLQIFPDSCLSVGRGVMDHYLNMHIILWWIKTLF